MNAKEASLIAKIARLDKSSKSASYNMEIILRKISDTAQNGFTRLEYDEVIPDYCAKALSELLKEKGYDIILIPIPQNINYYKIQIRWDSVN